MAAVRVVLPWSTWPMVPTLTCGFVLSDFCFPNVYFLLYESYLLSCLTPIFRQVAVQTGRMIAVSTCVSRVYLEPTAGLEPANLILTKNALCQLSYVGLSSKPRMYFLVPSRRAV